MKPLCRNCVLSSKWLVCVSFYASLPIHAHLPMRDLRPGPRSPKSTLEPPNSSSAGDKRHCWSQTAGSVRVLWRKAGRGSPTPRTVCCYCFHHLHPLGPPSPALRVPSTLHPTTGCRAPHVSICQTQVVRPMRHCQDFWECQFVCALAFIFLRLLIKSFSRLTRSLETDLKTDCCCQLSLINVFMLQYVPLLYAGSLWGGFHGFPHSQPPGLPARLLPTHRSLWDLLLCGSWEGAHSFASFWCFSWFFALLYNKSNSVTKNSTQ